jgi:hypothetical protein
MYIILKAAKYKVQSCFGSNLMNYGIIPLILRRYSCKITDWESLGGKWPHSDGNDDSCYSDR